MADPSETWDVLALSFPCPAAPESFPEAASIVLKCALLIVMKRKRQNKTKLDIVVVHWSLVPVYVRYMQKCMVAQYFFSVINSTVTITLTISVI